MTLSWNGLLDLEPRLLALERRAQMCRSDDWRDWSLLKSELSRLVGWDSGNHGELGTPDAYELAFTHLLAAWEGEVA